MHRETSGSFSRKVRMHNVSASRLYPVTTFTLSRRVVANRSARFRPCTDPSRNQYKAGRSAKRRPHILDDVSSNANSMAENAAPTRPRKAVCQKSELVPAERMGLALDTF